MIQLTDKIVSSISLIKHFQGPGDTGIINSLDFSRDGSVLCCASDDELIRIYNADQGTESGRLYSKKYGVDLIRFTNSNRNVLHASKNIWNYTIRYLSLGEYSYLRYFTGHRDQVVSLSMSPSDESFMSASEDCTVKIWDLRSTTCQGTIHRMKRLATCFDPAGIVMCVASSINTISLYDRRYFDRQPFMEFQVDRPPLQWQSIEIDRTGQYILALTDVSAMLFDAFDGRLLEEYINPVNNEKLKSIAFSPDSEYITAGTSDCKLLIWRCRGGRTGQQQGGLKYPLLALEGHKKPVLAVKWNPLKAMISSGDTQIRFWVPNLT